MLKNVDTMNQNYMTLAKLNEMVDHTFYLTGSRFFKPEKVDQVLTDWDFFVEFSSGLLARLEEIGYTIISTSDTDYVEISGTQNIVCIMRKGEVDVQLVMDAKGKEWIQNLLREHSRLIGKGKKDRKKEWMFAYKLAYGNEALIKGIVIPSLSGKMD